MRAVWKIALPPSTTTHAHTRAGGVQDGGDDDDTLCTQAFPCEQGVRLPAGTSTVYTESCWSTETLLSGHQGPAAPWHVVGIHADVMKASEAHMHHFVVRGFLDDDDCGRGGGGGAVGGLAMAEVLWAWAPGADALMLPSEAGFPIVHANSTDGFGYRSIAVQVLTHPHTHPPTPQQSSSRTVGNWTCRSLMSAGLPGVMMCMTHLTAASGGVSESLTAT
jgi:hypothetical protein